MDFAISSPGPSLFLLPLLVLAVPLVLWIGFASTLARRDAVDRPNRIAQWYGYSVCLVAVVVLLMTLTAIVNNLFTLANPLQGENDYGPALSSFEAYRATHHQSPYMDPTEREAARRAPPSDAELRTRYQALRADRIERNRYQAQRSLVSAGLLTLFAVGLFLFHWRWLRRLGSTAEPAAHS
jgi:uncharacterized membrane protein YcjF (UPF0283 family)